jgi:hypothetical protein
MIDYSKYSTDDPFRKPNFDSIYESKGIPNILKNLSLEILNDIIDNENEFNKNYNIDNPNFNVSFNVSIFNMKRNDIYATSDFGIYSTNKLKSSNIKIYLDISNYV